jgi:hypothetical protein
MTKVGLDIFETLSQMPLQFVAIQLCTDLNCCSAVLWGIPSNKSLNCGNFGMGWFQDNWDVISSILLRTVEIEMFLVPVDLWRYYLQLYL